MCLVILAFEGGTASNPPISCTVHGRLLLSHLRQASSRYDAMLLPKRTSLLPPEELEDDRVTSAFMVLFESKSRCRNPAGRDDSLRIATIG